MFVDATTNPAPSIRGRVSCIRHVRAGVETPSRVLFVADLVATAEYRPDGIGAAPAVRHPRLVVAIVSMVYDLFLEA